MFSSGTIDISASSSVRGFTVPVAGDDVVEGDEGFTFTLSNPTNGAVIMQATATGTIRDDDGAGPPNAPPLAIADRAATDPGTPVTVDVLANDTDPDDDPLATVSAGAAAGRAPANGAVAVVGDSVRYTSDSGFSGIDVFDYRVEDGAGGAATASVAVRVGPIDLPSGVTRGTPAADTLLIAQNSAYVGVAGPDAFLLSDAAAPNAVSLVDGAPDDLLQVIDGLAVAGFEVRPDSLLLDLGTGAQLRLSQASLIGFEVGANPTVSDTGTVTDFTGFVESVLGAEVPVTGSVTGGPTIIDEALIA